MRRATGDCCLIRKAWRAGSDRLRGRSVRIRTVSPADQGRLQVPGGGAGADATQAGREVKTNRRDAAKLARYLRSNDLTFIAVPDAERESVRDLIRSRQSVQKDVGRMRRQTGLDGALLGMDEESS